ncbi:GntR family transcriptional regulator [Micromonospora sp. WMMD967]|uniref:GntR family transcriptional regulator n=1 Tax=Micromonospora sp. WMMD967 TaxID=3016101 RepID=UPI00241718DD|nr:GntR family transcriptional regulator [Micromonospora sp. WMMD967]MDG4840123.1 GntR family transcriptional regulator [Micromonospora sp. WMMD967]
MNDVAASPMDGELESVSLVDLAVTRLTRDILSGRSDPGERLVEEQLTRRLGISRAPLREALRLLAQRGLVEHVPRRGVRVATLSERDVRELYELRDVLERFAVRAGIPVGRESDLVGLRTALDRMAEAVRLGDRMAVAESHRAFHVALVALADNSQLSAVYDSILVKLQLYMAINLRREAELAQPLDGVHRHERLFEAVAGGDPEEVLAVLSAHGARSYLG